MSMNVDEIRGRIAEALVDALLVYQVDGGDFNSGRYDGLKLALSLIDAAMDREAHNARY